MREKKSIISIFIFVMMLIYIIHIPNSQLQKASPNIFSDPVVSAGTNRELIDSIFNDKILDYYNNEYFKQVYEPSLQATYYALYSLNATGKLDYINHSELIDYIMSFYDPSSNLFIDILAYRYLDSDFDFTFTPLSSVLEVNCYAILSLELLSSLDLLDQVEMIAYIWSCYNPITSGFIGQPYDLGLEDEFKISTLDNTYFAIITLDLLMSDWTGYSTQKQELINYINSLQLPEGAVLGAGGFNNDNNDNFNSLNPLLEPNLLTSYYALKSLEIFGVEDSIQIQDFHQFLDNLYDSNDDYFQMSDWTKSSNYTNIVATAIGLELSNITNYSAINRDEVMQFILKHRNSMGNWDCSTTVAYHELIDTFQILRSLSGAQEISQLSFEDRNEIGNATLNYKSYRSFSLLSEDYTSMSLLRTITSAFSLYDLISELDIQQLYLQIKNSYNDFAAFGISRHFHGYVTYNSGIIMFRSHPIEYYTLGKKNYIDEISQINSHEATYYALQSLLNIFKLDDFASSYNLMSLINDIVATQFLNGSFYNTFGAFSSYLQYGYRSSDFINKFIFCDYTYFAIKSLEILSNYLSLNLVDLGFDTTALYTYIDRNIIETPTQLYFDPHYSANIDTVLKTTYYMVYVLEAIGMNNKNSQKIKNFIEANLNYSNIENIYYSYSLSELLNLDIEFDSSLIHDLLQNTFSEDYNEFYLTPNKITMGQEIFLWICDMARNSEIKIEANYSNNIPLGGVNHIEVCLYNLILRDFETYITFKFESAQLGSYVFSKSADSTYVCDISVPIGPFYYPNINGYLRAYEGTEIKAEKYISFSTTYNLSYTVNYQTNVSSVLFEINASILTNGGYYPLNSGYAYAKVYRDGDYSGQVQATHQEFSDYDTFSILCSLSHTGHYRFELYLKDVISGSIINIEVIMIDISEIIENFENEVMSAIPLTVIFLTVPGIVIVFSSRQLKKTKANYKNS